MAQFPGVCVTVLVVTVVAGCLDIPRSETELQVEISRIRDDGAYEDSGNGLKLAYLYVKAVEVLKPSDWAPSSGCEEVYDGVPECSSASDVSPFFAVADEGQRSILLVNEQGPPPIRVPRGSTYELRIEPTGEQTEDGCGGTIVWVDGDAPRHREIARVETTGPLSQVTFHWKVVCE